MEKKYFIKCSDTVSCLHMTTFQLTETTVLIKKKKTYIIYFFLKIFPDLYGS